MNKIKSLIIAGTWQFGYGSGTDSYSQELSKEYSITYICFDQGKEKIVTKDVKVEYVIENQNRLIRKIKFLLLVYKSIIKSKKPIVYVTYFRLCFLIPLFFPFTKSIVDYRSGNVSNLKRKRILKNALMRYESFFFKKRVAISKELIAHLKLPKDSIVLPVGSEIKSTHNKSFDKFNILYVGVLTNRNIDETIYGVSKFNEKHPGVLNHYHIIGKGDTEKIKNEIKKYRLQDKVTIHGYLSKEKLQSFYDTCNVGICYAPMTEYYMPQPFTKLYEYVLAGMSVVSVRLNDSVERVDNKIGVLCQDNTKSFFLALEELYLKRKILDSNFIREQFTPFLWENLSNNFKEIIDE